ncbi:uncharacterized protein B4U79_13990 [Dinothrombium tinctorium]|uniref:Uncharacterized protein n=1 Tax=Dinothrombium tinctorium TaxID=1965070 RepID=A0A443RR37_9ACAR|nr:uncharacterized protein B4U79_13990 [Dinothrombium tinctorium]
MSKRVLKEKDFDCLLLKLSSLDASDKDLCALNSLNKLFNNVSQSSFAEKRYFLLLFFAILIIAILPLINIREIFIRDDTECIVKLPDKWEGIFLPRFDCSLCSNLQKISKLSEITREEFEAKYAYTAIPVVITDAMQNWTTDVFDFDFFKNLYTNEKYLHDEYETECQFFPYKTNFTSLKQVFEMNKQRAANPWYVGWSNCNPQTANILRKHYEKPYFLPHSSESSRIDWIFMGSPGYGAHLHVDHVGNPSWQAQIKGRKLWTIEANSECYLQCKPIQVIVEPGEIIVIDTDKWFHKTLIIGDEISITIGSEFD